MEVEVIIMLCSGFLKGVVIGSVLILLYGIYRQLKRIADKYCDKENKGGSV